MVNGTIGKIHGIKNARKPPTSPAIKVSHKVFSFSALLAFTSVLVAVVVFVVSLTVVTGTTLAVSTLGASSGAISVNSRSAVEVSASCANTVLTEPKNIKSPTISTRKLINMLLFNRI
ncbi:hypothetical protein D3C87_294110 [compost metagenome]